MGNGGEEKRQFLPGREIQAMNYLNTERTIAASRWVIIGFLLLYFNILKPQGWPIGLFNGVLLLGASYNLGITLYIRKTRLFSVGLSLLSMYCDMITVAAGLHFTGGAKSPFLFIWYLTLFAAGIRFGFLKSLFLQVPMAGFYAYLLYRDVGGSASDFFNQLILGFFAFVAVSMYGTIFSREEQYTARLMADFHRESITDRLTGLYNYAYFIDELKKEQFRADRASSHFSLLIFDLDFFKRVNDTHGHEKGNILLQGVADILRANARRMDTVARYGGEEFVVLMPESNGSEMEVAERIRKKVEEAEFPGIAEKPLKITISAGACSYPRDAKSVFELLDKADKGLYEAKSTGRNRACYCK